MFFLYAIFGYNTLAMKYITPNVVTLLILLLGCHASTTAQNTLGTLSNSDEALDGYLLFSPRTSDANKNTYLLNNCGEIINQWPSTLPLFSTDYLMPDGSLYRSVVDNQSTLNIPGNTGRIEHLDWDGNLLWGLTYSDTDFSFHHDYIPLSNGNILILAAHRRTEAEALDRGRDPLLLSTTELYEERIIEIEPTGVDGFNIVWEWRSWDHLIQDFDNTKMNFGVVEDHPELMDINFGTNVGEADWWHSNSLSYSETLDQIIISNRNHDEFIIIDHSTTTAEAATHSGGNSGMGGDILYRWGNPQSYDKGTASDQVLYGQHNVQFIPEGLPNAGKIMIFNNGNDLDHSSILIIDAPYNTSTQTYDYFDAAYGPSTPDWEYEDPTDPTNFHATFISGCQQLPNGNVLICAGPQGFLFEVDSAGNTVWEYQSPVGNSGILTDGDDPNTEQTRVFRSVKYPVDYAAFEGRDLTPGPVVEINPVDDNCQLLSIDEVNPLQTVQVTPTVSSGTFELKTYGNSEKNYNIEVLNLNGKSLLNLKNHNDRILDLNHLNSGMYLLNVTSGSYHKVFKILIN